MFLFIFLQGLSKHKLLRDILDVVSTNLRWQRLWTEYTDQLKSLEELQR